MLATLSDCRCRFLVAVALMVTLVATTPAVAGQACDADTSARLEYLETTLDEGRRHAAWWWRGWLAVFSAGALLQGTKAALTRYKGHDADVIVGASKSLLGVVDLSLHPLAARNGAAAVRAVPADSADNCARRLAVAESTLAEAARQAETRYSWRRHLSSLALNLGAAALVSEVWNDRATAWQSFVVSEAASEAHIWSQPWRAIGDWGNYRSKFDGIPTAGVAAQWRLAVRPGGLGISWKF